MMRAVIAMVLMLPASADAATIEVVPLKDKRFGSVITVSGEIRDGDNRILRDKIDAAPQPAIVAFNSPGGHLATGLRIGELIREKGLPTMVPSMMTCASACALAWLAGRERYIAKTGRVGFHAAWMGPGKDVSAVGNALAGAYLYKIGLRPVAIEYVTSAAPTSIEWINKGKAGRVGISFFDDDPMAMVIENGIGITPAKGVPLVANWDQKHDKLAVELPKEAAPAPAEDLRPPALLQLLIEKIGERKEAPCEADLSEIFGNKLPNDALLHQLCAKP